MIYDRMQLVKVILRRGWIGTLIPLIPYVIIPDKSAG